MKSREPVTTEWVRAQPKAELHLHLLGAMRPATAFDLARKHSVDFPIASVERWKSHFATGDLGEFVEAFIALFDLLRDEEDFYRVALEVFEDLASDGIAYVEPRLTLTSHLSRGVSRETICAGLIDAAQSARKDFGVEVAWIVDFPRVLGPETGEIALQEAIHGMEWGVVGFDIAGYEADHGATEAFGKLFLRAKEAGLKTTAHAGEVGAPSHIRTALRDWRVDRIGHGVRAVEDPELVQILARDRVPLEISPTCNVLLGASGSMASHPLEELRRAGVPITLNTDDPSLFGIRLSEEFETVARTFGWTREIALEVIQNGWDCRFKK